MKLRAKVVAAIEAAGCMNISRPIYEIAAEIKRDWKRPYFGAVPYLRAMHAMESIDDSDGYDSGRSIVLYFLANSFQWQGETSMRIKAELSAMIKKQTPILPGVRSGGHP